MGGLSPEAAAIYTRFLHEEVRTRCGEEHSANLRSALLNQHRLALACARGEWTWLSNNLGTVARGLVTAGAEALVFDSSTLHVVAQPLQAAAGVPLLHIIAACERALAADGITCAGLLGTRCAEEEEMWRDWLQKRAGIDIVLPPKRDRELVAQLIHRELAWGRIKEASRVTMIRTMKALKRAGARGIVVVAPELLSITFSSDTPLAFYGAARLHACAAVQWAFAAVPQAV